MLNMDFVLRDRRGPGAVDRRRPDPYMHVFLDAGNGNVLALLRAADPAARWGATRTRRSGCSTSPSGSRTAPSCCSFKAHLEAERRRRCSASTDHGAFHSIYFFDPNGHRVELACPDPDEDAIDPQAGRGEVGHARGMVEDQARAQARRLPARQGVEARMSNGIDDTHDPALQELARVGQRPGDRLPDPEPAVRALPPRRRHGLAHRRGDRRPGARPAARAG